MKLTEIENELVSAFLKESFGDYSPSELTQAEEDIIAQCMSYVDQKFTSMKYILGLGLDFTILSQRLSNHDEEMKAFTPGINIEKIFQRYGLVKYRGENKANTLTLTYSDKQEGIRKIEESVANLFHALDRSDYPSAYVYNTGQWQKYQDLLVYCFSLSESGKYILCNLLISYGLSKLPKNSFYVRETPRIRLFEIVVHNYPRGVKGENGGLVYQAIAYGFLSADRPHLSLIADKVRTGSSRQKRFGDIDCYFGLDIETSVEVKDFDISINQYEKELAEFCRNCKGNNVNGIAFIKDIDEDAKKAVEEQGVQILTQDIILNLVSYWDWPKQNAALQGVLHYLSHIEQNPNAVNRLLAFIKANDEHHDALVYYKD